MEAGRNISKGDNLSGDSHCENQYRNATPITAQGKKTFSVSR